jgi:hypothetical protein
MTPLNSSKGVWFVYAMDPIELVFGVALAGGALLGAPIVLPAVLVAVLWALSLVTPHAALACMCASGIAILLRERCTNTSARILWILGVYGMYYLIMYSMEVAWSPTMSLQVLLWITALFMIAIYTCAK